MFFGGQTYGLTCWLLSAHFCSASKLNWRLYGKVSVRNRSINELYNNLIAIKERILPSFKYSLFLAHLLAKTGLDIFCARQLFFPNQTVSMSNFNFNSSVLNSFCQLLPPSFCFKTGECYQVGKSSAIYQSLSQEAVT